MTDEIRYWVYVIELDPAELKNVGPRGAVYVGQSYNTPEERFAQHKAGYRASRFVKKHGVKLRPELFPQASPFATRAEAEAAETSTGEHLASLGFSVYGAH